MTPRQHGKAESWFPPRSVPRLEFATVAKFILTRRCGNLTLVGSVANLIVAEKARQAGIEISFWRYARVGVPVTLATLALGAWRLS